ncbi:hypothetical protein ACE3MS_30270 [Paenibacillus dendritiformis]|uniref:hypothetical protein n=1 Tax=Paenibacillus dendritiformis TaxID=130049 RepID=UPI003660374C
MLHYTSCCHRIGSADYAVDLVQFGEHRACGLFSEVLNAVICRDIRRLTSAGPASENPIYSEPGQQRRPAASRERVIACRLLPDG